MKKEVTCQFSQAGAYKSDCTYSGQCPYQETGAYYPMCGKPDDKPVPQQVKQEKA